MSPGIRRIVVTLVVLLLAGGVFATMLFSPRRAAPTPAPNAAPPAPAPIPPPAPPLAWGRAPVDRAETPGR